MRKVGMLFLLLSLLEAIEGSHLERLPFLSSHSWQDEKTLRMFSYHICGKVKNTLFLPELLVKYEFDSYKSNKYN